MNVSLKKFVSFEKDVDKIPLEVLEKLSDLFGVEEEYFFAENLKEPKLCFPILNSNQSDLKNISAFKKIIKNYLKMSRI